MADSGWSSLAAPCHSLLELGEERAAVKAAGQRIDAGQELQLVVLPANIVARLAELVEHVLELLVLFLDRGHVVEGGQCAAPAAVGAEDRRGVYDERPLLIGRVQAHQHAGVGGAFADGFFPGEGIIAVLPFAERPAEVGCLFALKLSGAATDLFGERVVRQHDSLLPVEHQHALGQRVERGTDPLGNNRRGVQVLEDSPQVESSDDKRHQRDDDDQLHRLGQPGDKPPGRRRPKPKFDFAPASLAFEDRHFNAVLAVARGRSLSAGLKV